jgi:hypothetical protein
MSLAAPTISGQAVEGQQLVERQGTWSDAPLGLELQWERCNRSATVCSAIPGATRGGYVLGRPDIGSVIRVRETAVNRFGTGGPAVSAVSKVVADAPLSVTATALLGTAGSVVSGQVATFSDPSDRAAPAANYSPTVDWGDGSKSAGKAVAATGGGYRVIASHAYGRAGIYTMSVTVRAKFGAAATNTTRISVLPAAICTGQARGKSCLGQLRLPAGCQLPLTRMEVWLTRPQNAESVMYSIDASHHRVKGVGRNLHAWLSVAGLRHGAHRIRALIRYRSGHPATGTVTDAFRVCK